MELHPRYETGQFVVQLLEALAIGFLEGTDGHAPAHPLTARPPRQ
jgi:hypothetical protein